MSKEKPIKHLIVIGLLLSLWSAASCSRTTGSTDSGDLLTGTWVGDFGPAFYDRNTISLELKWDGTHLTGTVEPGVPGGRMFRNFKGFPIENASFDAKTGMLKFEASYQPKGRVYLIEGKLNKKTITGSWIRPEEKKDGDFKLTKQ